MYPFNSSLAYEIEKINGNRVFQAMNSISEIMNDRNDNFVKSNILNHDYNLLRDIVYFMCVAILCFGVTFALIMFYIHCCRRRRIERCEIVFLFLSDTKILEHKILFSKLIFFIMYTKKLCKYQNIAITFNKQNISKTV